MAALVGVLGVLLAAFVKGAIGFGFPAVSTPILALSMDVKTAIVNTILPNLVMDAVQSLRRPGFAGTLRRHAALLACGIVGTFVGTYLLKLIPGRLALLILGLFVLSFVVTNWLHVTVRVDPRRERLVSPPVGFFVGVVGGVTNVPGTPLVIYFYALGLDKADFVRSVSLTFLVYKATQLLAVMLAGLMTTRFFGASAALSAVGLGGFWLGLRVQDRVDQQTFNRAVLGFLALLGAWLVIRAL